jgi:hypothetical protein
LDEISPIRIDIYTQFYCIRNIDVGGLPPVHTPASVEVWSTSSRDSNLLVNSSKSKT